MLGLYGGQDGFIPLAQIDEMKAKLQASGGASKIIVYPDAGHGFFADYRPTTAAPTRRPHGRRRRAGSRSMACNGVTAQKKLPTAQQPTLAMNIHGAGVANDPSGATYAFSRRPLSRFPPSIEPILKGSKGSKPVQAIGF